LRRPSDHNLEEKSPTWSGVGGEEFDHHHAVKRVEDA